jgi:hypothetical protein
MTATSFKDFGRDSSDTFKGSYSQDTSYFTYSIPL